MNQNLKNTKSNPVKLYGQKAGKAYLQILHDSLYDYRYITMGFELHLEVLQKHL